MKNRVLSTLLLAGMALVASNAFASASGEINFPNPIQVNGTTIPAGLYKVKADDNGLVTISKGKNAVATVQGKLVPASQNDGEQWVAVAKQADGSEKLRKIHFAKQKNVIAFEENGSSGS